MINVQHLTKKFGEFTAVDDVSFNINQGETFALLGPNGSGKSTILKCLAGLAVPTAGTISVNDFDLATHGKQARSALSYLPQQVNFHESLTAREVLQFYCKLRKLSETRITDVLKTSNFSFNGFTDKPVHQFSGGMLQRLGLAVACLPDAPILLLDEPSASLDPERAIQLRDFLNKLRAAGKTIVFTSHVLTDVEQLADRVAILVSGKLVALESINALREALESRSQMRITLDSVAPKFAAIATQLGATEIKLEQNDLLLNCVPDKRMPILEAIKDAGGIIQNIATQEPSLENIYLRYIKSHEQL